jgi:hypothetical protein
MKSATAKETDMKTLYTNSYVRLVSVLAVAAPIAAIMGTSGHKF